MSDEETPITKSWVEGQNQTLNVSSGNPAWNKDPNFVEPDVDTLENRIQNHKPTDDAIQIIETNRRYALGWSHYVLDNVPPGRERSTAFAKIEEALFWSNAAIARKPENQA
jgi:hypothetical protein